MDKFTNATFARYAGRCVILLGKNLHGNYIVRFFGETEAEAFAVPHHNLREF